KTLTFDAKRLRARWRRPSDYSRKPSPFEVGGTAQRHAGRGTEGAEYAPPANAHLWRGPGSLHNQVRGRGVCALRKRAAAVARRNRATRVRALSICCLCVEPGER